MDWVVFLNGVVIGTAVTALVLSRAKDQPFKPWRNMNVYINAHIDTERNVMQVVDVQWELNDRIKGGE